MRRKKRASKRAARKGNGATRRTRKQQPNVRSAPAAGAPDQVELLLQRNATTAQENLDEYVAAVCDPKVLAPLKHARNAARAALDEYRRTTA